MIKKVKITSGEVGKGCIAQSAVAALDDLPLREPVGRHAEAFIDY